MDDYDSEEEDVVNEIPTPISPTKSISSPTKRKTILRSRRNLCKQPSKSGMICKYIFQNYSHHLKMFLNPN